MADDLTPRQQAFVQEYLIDLNGTQAAIRAGYAPDSAFVTASRLLSNAKVAAAVKEAMQARSQRTQITADWVLQRLAKYADYNSRDFSTLETKRIKVHPKGGGEPVEIEVQDVVFNENFDGEIVRGLSKGKDGIKMDMPDSIRALELIGRHLGMWKDRVEHSGTMHHTHTDLSHLSNDELDAEYEKLKGEK